MKTPEEYLAPNVRCRDWFPADNRTMIDEKGAIAALKSMQEDHEKELIDFLEYSDRMEIGSTKIDWLLMSAAQRLTQFRNKQQDR